MRHIFGFKTTGKWALLPREILYKTSGVKAWLRRGQRRRRRRLGSL